MRDFLLRAIAFVLFVAILVGFLTAIEMIDRAFPVPSREAAAHYNLRTIEGHEYFLDRDSSPSAHKANCTNEVHLR